MPGPHGPGCTCPAEWWTIKFAPDGQDEMALQSDDWIEVGNLLGALFIRGIGRVTVEEGRTASQDQRHRGRVFLYHADPHLAGLN